jgi:hypothetical protein
MAAAVVGSTGAAAEAGLIVVNPHFWLKLFF